MQPVFLGGLGSRGFRFRGPEDYSLLGVVSAAGDVNGDGIDDFIVAGNANDLVNNGSGYAYVIYGRSDGQFGAITLATLGGSDGFRIHGAPATAGSNYDIASAGDFNGDGYDDIVIGGVNNSNGTCGAWLVFGGPTGMPTVELSALTASQGFAITAPINDASGFSVSSAGDINHDGYDDIVIGSPEDGTGGNFAGQAHVIFGKASGFGTISLASFPAGAGFVIRGDAASEFVGHDVSTAGDVNGDGIDDLLVSAPFADEGGGNDTGAIYLIYGKTSPFGTINLATLGGSDGAIIRGVERIGWSVAGAGDVNGDGYQDIVIGAPQANGFHGRAYVVFGQAGGIGSLDVTTMTASQGFRIEGSSFDHQAGYTVAGAGDVDGDGYDDILVGVPFDGAGTTYLILGKGSGFGTINLGDMKNADTPAGASIFGEGGSDASGRTLSSAGDVNEDGVADILIGSRDNNGAGFARGASYLVFGLLPTTAVVRTGTVAGQNLTGGNLDDQLFGLGGDDVLYGNGGADLLDGGDGNDYLNGGLGADTIFGGAGDDTAKVIGADSGLDTINLGSGADHLIVDYGALTGAVTFSLPSFGGNGAHSVISVGGVERVHFEDVDRMTITTGSGDDDVYSIGGDDLIFTQGGNDTIRSTPTSTRDRIDGGAGIDTVRSVDWSDLAEAVVFNLNDPAGVTIGAGASERYLRGIEQLINFFTGTGNDVITLSTNAALSNRVFTGQGNDVVTAYGGPTAATTAVESFIDLGLGSNQLFLDYSAAIEEVTFSSQPPFNVVPGFGGVAIGGVHTLSFQGVEKLIMTSGSANDSLFGTGGADVLSAGAGNDTMDGNAGDDILIGGTGSDTMAGRTGNDIYYVDSAGDVVTEAAGEGNDRIATSVSYALAAGSEVEQLEAVSSAATDAMDLTGNGFANTITGNAGVNILRGEGGSDILGGLAGNDFLVGGTGADFMYGGTGDDTYYVDDLGDQTSEQSGEGTDRIATSVSYALLAGSEIELLEGLNTADTNAIDLTGSNFANLIIGNAGVNILRGEGGNDTLVGFGGSDFLVGGAGADLMYGGIGDDTYYVDNLGDQANEAAGEGTDRIATSISFALQASSEVELLETVNTTDTSAMDLTGSNFANAIIGSDGVNILRGEGGNDTLTALGGDDFLVGGAGNDAMFGGLGNDTYYVDSALDTVTEAAGQGNDRIATSVSYALAAGSEVETLEAVNQADTSAMNLTGNGFANTIVGSNGANTLDGQEGNDVLIGFAGDDVLAGGAGSDAMTGGLGNDIYYVDTAGDTVTEAVGQGNDRIATSVGYTLAAGSEIETLEAITQADTSAMNLTGNAGANTIAGNDGANILDGKGGNDLLVGYGGADTFAFTTALAAGNADQIAGFVSGTDKIALDDAVFTGLAAGALAATAFVTGTAALDADDRIVYNSATGELFFDADGNGAGAAILFATLQGHPPLAAGDFIVI